MEAKDTHKAFQSLEILLHGTACEFVKKYISFCHSNKRSPDADGFLYWASENENETFKLVFELIFNFCLAVYIQKLGVRSNDAKMIAAARYKFMPLFFAFNHPIYQEIEYRDLKKQVLYPPEIKRFLDDNMSFSLNLDLNHQGGDFCLEGKIKRVPFQKIYGEESLVVLTTLRIFVIKQIQIYIFRMMTGTEKWNCMMRSLHGERSYAHQK